MQEKTRLWAGMPARNAMGCGHHSCAGQVALTSESEPLQCILCFGL